MPTDNAARTSQATSLGSRGECRPRRYPSPKTVWSSQCSSCHSRGQCGCRSLKEFPRSPHAAFLFAAFNFAHRAFCAVHSASSPAKLSSSLPECRQPLTIRTLIRTMVHCVKCPTYGSDSLGSLGLLASSLGVTPWRSTCRDSHWNILRVKRTDRNGPGSPPEMKLT